MSEKQTSAQTRSGTVLAESQGVYHALFERINLKPLAEMGGIEAFQSVEVLSEASADERVTASISVFLICSKARRRKSSASTGHCSTGTSQRWIHKSAVSSMR